MISNSEASKSSVHLKNMCTGMEDSLAQCGVVIQDSKCPAQSVVTCQPGKTIIYYKMLTVILGTAACDPNVRLVDGYTHHQGRVEVCVNGQWGTVCNIQQEMTEAICFQLGFTAIGRYTNT